MSFDLKVINGDLSLKNGDLQKVVDSEKLIQSVLKICLTEAGSSPINPWYGSYLSRSIIGSVLQDDVLKSLGKSQIANCLDNLKKIQKIQVNSFTNLTPDEQLSSVADIYIGRDITDPRLYQTIIKIITKGFKPVTVAFKINTI